MIPRRFLLFVAAAFVLQFQMYAQLRMMLIILSLAQFQLEGRAFLRLFEIRRRRRNRRGHPYFWVLPRPADSWFDIHYNDPRIPDEYFRKQLRMRRATFRLLLDVLRPYITRQNTRFRRCIEPEKVLAIGLTRLAHGGTYVSIGPGFNVGTTTVIEAVEDVVTGLVSIKHDYIKFPETEAQVVETRETFEELSDLPNVAGAIDCTHVTIKAPTDSRVDYFSRFQRYDIIVQAVADGKKRFLDVAAGFPGSLHDARVLRNSRLYRRCENQELLTGPTVNVLGREIGPYLVADSAYFLAPWLQKVYPEETQDPDEIAFNEELSSARVSVECAFGILKSRWRILTKQIESGVSSVSDTVVACAVLHNFCINAGDEWEWDDGDDDGGNDNDANVLRDGDDIRELLKEYIAM